MKGIVGVGVYGGGGGLELQKLPDFARCDGSINPKPRRIGRRLAAGLYRLNGVDLSPPSTTLAHGKKRVE